ncbi:PE domain-containing protein [Nocardia callitridis]|uniref:PE domain-containing protein n=1 Tax=Nocardia callitridis TaxID=648753 RepID=A0ABP9KWG3_9NOCA
MSSSGVDFEGVAFDPAAARKAATQLDGLADRLADGLSAEEIALRPEPSGTDEVSLRASRTMSDVANSYGDSASSGVLELRKLAATLRSQANQFGSSEDASAAEFGGSAPSTA